MKQCHLVLPILLFYLDNVFGGEWIGFGENAKDREFRVKRNINEPHLRLVDDKFDDAPANYQKSLVIVFDDTGSMQDDWVQLRKGVKRLVNTYASLQEKPIFDYILVRFNDPIIRLTHHTRDPQRFIDVLDRMLVMGGDDCAELTFHGIIQGMRASLKYSDIYVFTDASAKDNEYFNITLDIARMKQLKVSFFVTGQDCQGEDFRLFKSLARHTHGNFYQLNKARVEDAIVGITDALKSGTIPIEFMYSDKAGSEKILVSVDSSLKMLSVTLTSEEQEFRIINPHHVEEIRTEVLLKSSSVMMAKVDHPEPGEWHVEYNASSEHSLKITGATDNLYRYGFSYTPPKAFSDTILNPIKGIKNYLAIFVWGNKQQNKLAAAEIVIVTSKTESSYANYTLNPVDLDNNEDDFCMYTTDSFVPPTNPFKIYVHGTDSKGFPSKYLLSINIEAIDGDSFKPEVAIDTSSINPIEGNDVRLVCKVKSMKTAVINWIFQNKTIEDDYRTRVSFKKNDTVQLDLLGVNDKDVGLYFCQARSAFGQNDEKVFINVTLLPWDIQLMPQDIHAIENEENLKIKCVVSPKSRKVNILWLHDGRNVSETKDIQISGNILRIKKVSRHHQGNYTCKASYGGGIKVVSEFVTVFYPPEIIGPQFERHVVSFGDRIELNCSAVGNPKPLISWIRPDGNKTSIPVIERFAPSHIGTYMCNATNGIGNPARKVIVLETKYGLKPIVEAVFSKLSVVEGDSINMTCKVNGLEPIESAWKLNRHDTGLRREIEISESSSASTLIITNSRLDDSGEYTCSFRNAYGIDEKTILLQVRPKQLRIEMKEAIWHAEEGNQNYVIECLAFPKDREVNWNWMSGDRVLHNSTDYQIFGAILVIKTVKRNHSGQYTCIGEFLGKRKHATGFLDVLYPPQIVGPTVERKIVKFDDEVVLNCNAIGNPTPTISWDRSDKLTSDHRIMRFSSSHYGAYTCSASNGIGIPAVKRVFLDSKPKGPPKLIHSQYNYEMEVGQNHTLICKCQACGPITYKSWKRLGNDKSIEIMGIDGSLEAHTKNFEFNLNLIGAQISDSGAYECTIRNEYGSSQRTVHVNVLSAPSITSITANGNENIENQKLIMKVGKYLKLTCNSIGSPKPAIFWYKDGKKIDQLKYFGNTIQLESVEEKDIGRYTCQAINKLGEASSHIDLHVIHVNLPVRTMMIADEGQIVSLPCNSHTIFFNEDLIDVNSSRYQILDGFIVFTAIYGDSGVYRCIIPRESTFEEIETVLMIQTPPRIYPTDDDTVFAAENKDVILSCRTEGNPMPKIAWSVNGKHIENSYAYAYLPGGALMIRKLQKSHEGSYVCRAFNKLGNSERRTYLIITDSPHSVEPENCEPQKIVKNSSTSGTDRGDVISIGNFTVEITTCPANEPEQRKDLTLAIQSKHHLVEGEDLVLRCPLLNEGTIAWYKDGIELSTNQADNTFFLQSTVRTEDSGTYFCTTSDLNGKNFTHHVKVFQSDDPYVYGDYYDQILIREVGDDLTLDCKDDGDIPIETQWLRKNRVLSTAKKLELKELQTSESGKYVCTDVHGAGLLNRPFFVLVKGPPDVHMPQENWIVLNEGESLQLDCLITGHPNPMIAWMRNSYGLTLNHAVLFVDNSSENDSGTYTCVGTNDYGSASVYFYVDILRKPKFEVATHGDIEVELECRANGNPLPAILWTFNEEIFFVYDTNEIVETYEEQFHLNGKIVAGERILFVQAGNQETNAGVHNCLAINGIGTAQAKITVTRIGPPKILSGSETSTIGILNGLPLFLQCPWKEESVTTVEWQKDSNLLNDGVSYEKQFFSIPTIKHDDKGVFTCSARNNAGSGTQAMVVDVKGPRYYFIDDENNDVVLKCPEVDGSDQFIVWEEFILEDENVTNTLSEKSTDLVVDWDRPSSIFSCYHENEITRTRVKKFEIQVIKTAPLKYYEITRFGEIGHAISLRCPLYFEDTRDLVVWFKNDLRFPRVPNGFFSENGAVLNIRSVSKEDDGSYKCRISTWKLERGIVLKTYSGKAQWSDWQPWSVCSRSCGGGIQSRGRTCFARNAYEAEQTCPGKNIEIRACNIIECPVNGNWSEWSAWSTCKTSCETYPTVKSAKSRTRTCNSPPPSMGGMNCVGTAIQEEICEVKACV